MKPLKQAKDDFIKQYLIAVLVKTRGRTILAAKIAGWSSPNFCQLLRRHKLKASSFRSKRFLRLYEFE